jgi:hypothetical protein
MDTKRLRNMLQRTRRRTPAPIPGPPAPLSPRLLRLAVEAIRALHADGPIHGERTFGAGKDKLWVHLVAGGRVEFAAPSCDGFPAHSAVLHQREFESMCAWIRAEFDSISKPKTKTLRTSAQQMKFVN